MNRYTTALLLSAACLLSLAGSYAQEPAESMPVVKGVILYLPTGMGDHHYRLLEAIAKSENRPTQLSRFSRQARMKTALLGTPIPDTSGAGSTLATGRKCPPQLISMAPDGGNLSTVFEEAQQSGRSVGLVTLGKLTDGAITAFAVHTPEEADYQDRARQIFELRPQVLVGCDREAFETARDSGDVPLLQRLVQDGYAIATDQQSLTGAQGSHLAAFFQHRFRADRRFYPGEPGLQQILFKALSILNRNPKGFFLVVETQALDHSCRLGDPVGTAHEMLELEEAVEAGLRFSERFPDTLLVIASPHETGNLMSLENDLPAFAQKYKTIQSSPVYLDREIGITNDIAAVLKGFRDIAGIPGLEPFEMADVCRTPAGPERVRVIASIMGHHVRGGQFAQDSPSARTVPFFVHGPGSALWPLELDNSQVAGLLRMQMGLQ